MAYNTQSRPLSLTDGSPSSNNTSTTVRPEYLNFGEQLFNDDAGKDIRLRARDGTAMAHAAVLRAVSKPFRQMFESDMAESRTRTVDLPDFTKAELVFFLRLLYTGQVDEGDWGGMSGTASYQVTVPGDAEPASAMLLNGTYYPAGHFRGAPKFLNSNQVLLYLGNDEEAGGPYWKLSWKEDEPEEEDEDDDGPDPRLEQLWSTADVTEEISDRLVGWDFSQRGGSMSGPPEGTWTHVGGVGIWGSPGKRPVTVKRIDSPPLSLILGSLNFGRKYLIEYMVSWLTEAAMDRLSAGTFEPILDMAIQLDIAPLRLHCLRFAESCPTVRSRYEAEQFEQNVMVELHAIWPRQERKRRRFF